MPTITALLIALLTALLTLAPLSPASAGRGGSGKDGNAGQGQGISASEAEAIARRQSGGRVLAVKPKGDGYQVKVLTPNGEVRQIFVPGR